MARRVIGLDVGTNAVTVAEVAIGAQPKLTAFGQVALARDAVRDGEVVDVDAVVDAIKRLRTEVGLRKAPVRIGLASPRLVVRQVEMPVMTRDDLASALRFQAQDLIPIPLDEAVLDFTILDTYQPGTGQPGIGQPAESQAGLDPALTSEPLMRVLLAAAQQTTVLQLVDAVERAGFPVESVDLVPLALIRSLGTTVSDNGSGAEAIVSIGGGVTCVVVHEGGTPRFVRVLANGGRALTDAIATNLELPPETAESLKRQIGSLDDEIVNQARASVERPLGVLLDEIRSSLDYYRNQPGASRLLRVQLTGGGAQLAGVRERLASLLGIPVEMAEPRAKLQVADIGFAPDELPRLDPYLAAAVGLALGDSAGLPVMNLLPVHTRRGLAGIGGSRGLVIALVAAAALLLLLAVPVVLRNNDASDLTSSAKKTELGNVALEARIASLSTASEQQRQIVVLHAQVDGVLQDDVSWARMLNELARTTPNNVWLTSFQGQVTPSAAPLPIAPTPTTAAASVPAPSASSSIAPTPTTTASGALGAANASSLQGNVTFGLTGLDFPSVADWLRRISAMRSFDNLWVPSAQAAQLGSREVVNFESTADLTDKAKSHREARYQKGAPR